ncbi:ALS_1a_G0016880.mRNA.1.CDS.1 [Saccharomyces cerevisiae]|nr:ALS_1a_G0016880.mRNA.1.CDS.1 [Saccharomyces cerevisiae]CAI6642504.1 ALS_1a_G0016880.mRNA.1.CDS.1 [Saccharomyces cerevisiae]
MNNANRAAHVITGSHSWGPHDSCAKFDKRMEFHVNAAKGDAVLFLGSLYHVASANHTVAHIDYKKKSRISCKPSLFCKRH